MPYLIRKNMLWKKKVKQEAINALEIVGRHENWNLKSAELPYELQRLIEIARALTMRPELLLLDKSVADLNLSELIRLCKIIEKIAKLEIPIIFN